MSDPKAEAERERYRNECVQAATATGLYYGGIGIAIGVAATLAANTYWPRFRILNASAKTAVVRASEARHAECVPERPAPCIQCCRRALHTACKQRCGTRLAIINVGAHVQAIMPGLFAGFASSEEKLVAAIRAKPV